MFINKRIRCGEHKKNGGKNGRTMAINEISTTFNYDYILTGQKYLSGFFIFRKLWNFHRKLTFLLEFLFPLFLF